MNIRSNDSVFLSHKCYRLIRPPGKCHSLRLLGYGLELELLSAPGERRCSNSFSGL